MTPLDPRTAGDVLGEAAALIADRRAYLPSNIHGHAENARNEPVEGTDREARRWTLFGALEHVTGETWGDGKHPRLSQAASYLFAAFRQRARERGDAAEQGWCWIHSDAIHHECAMDALRLALEQARAGTVVRHIDDPLPMPVREPFSPEFSVSLYALRNTPLTQEETTDATPEPLSG